MAVYTAYSDESGIGNPDGEFLVAGYLAEQSRWPEVIEAWRQRVLDGPPRIQMLHMTDIRHWRWRQKAGISYNNAECRISEAVRVIYSSGALDAVAAVIKRRDLYDFFPKGSKDERIKMAGLDEPDYVCYMEYILLILLRAHKLHRDATRVNFVFAEKEEVLKGMRQIEKATRAFLESEDPEIADLFGDFIPGNLVVNIPLQAADMICWHLQRYYRGGFPRTDENRMWYLLKERDGDLHVLDRRSLADMAARFAELSPSGEKAEDLNT